MTPVDQKPHKVPEVQVRRASFDLARPWSTPPDVDSALLTDSSTSRPSRLRSEVAIFHDGKTLLVQFAMEDDEMVATMYARDAPLWQEDVVEVFLAPTAMNLYYEIEVSPRGTLFDARVTFPGPDRRTMTVDTGWECGGLHALVRRETIDAKSRLDVVVIIPFTGLPTPAPQPGDSWRANFYRIDRSPRGDIFDAWSPTFTTDPDFHVPERFGRLVFR